MLRKWKGLIILAAVVLSIWALYPTLKLNRLNDEDRQYMEPSKLEGLEAKAIHLGLDLQGGMHLVLEVDVSQLPDEEKMGAIEGVKDVIESRVNQFGVSEAVVQREGRNRIIVELPGLRDIERASKLIGQTAQLEFKLLKDTDELAEVIRKIDRVLASGVASVKKGEEKPSELFESEGFLEDTLDDSLLATRPFSSLLVDHSGDIAFREGDSPKVEAILADSLVRKAIPPDGEFVRARKAEIGKDGSKVYPLYYVKSKPEMTGASVADARATIGSGTEPNIAGRPIINFTTTKEAVRLFSRITGSNVGERLAIVLDGRAYSAPVIQVKIRNGRSIITGMKDLDEARDLAIAIRTGALPAPVRVIGEWTVGPSLGSDSIRGGFRAALIGFVVVVIFMIIYYSFSGLIADLALVLNLIFIMAVLAGFRFTLTLPGVAGIILTIGMAVDANVLIFERIREELRAGRTLRLALDNGYSKAFKTILDANVTTIIAAVFLYQFGTGPIKGFALTLFIGILSSMFTAIVVTRAVLEWILSRREYSGLRIGKSLLFTESHFGFISLRRKAFILSAAFILAGIIFFGVNRGLNLGIDFTGGTLLEAHFDPPVPVSEVRESLSDVGVGDQELDFSKSEIKQFGNPNNILIRVPTVPGKEGVLDAIKEKLKTSFPQSISASSSEWIRRQEQVGPKIGGELSGKAVRAIIYALLGILVYVGWRFEFKFALAAVVALFHDVLFTVGVFAAVRWEVSLAVVAALLTIVGYSLNDTIVVFDRIRENLRIYKREDYASVINRGINETLSRTIITSVTTLFVILSLLLLGGEVIRGFAIALTIGVIVGTYSSIFVASPILVEWRLRKERKSAQAEEQKRGRRRG